MLTAFLCVIFAIAGGLVGAALSRGKQPAPVIVGVLVGAVVGLAPLAFTQAMVEGWAARPGLLARIAGLVRALREGEPVIWAITLVVLLFLLVVLAVWAKTARDLRREDEERQRRRGGRR